MRTLYADDGRAYYRPMRTSPAPRSNPWPRILFALAMVAFAFFSYQCSTEYNPVTGEEQHIALTPHQEIALGLQALPEMMAQHGGELRDPRLQALVDAVGRKVVAASDAGKTDWQFDFHLLADPRTVNAFALPGGQVFITYALLSKLETEGQLAGVLGHEVGHVVARHGAQRIAKQQLTEGLTGAVLVASGSADSARMAQMVGQMVNMSYGREDELQSDALGVRFMSQAGYDPRAMIGVQLILADSSGGEAPPEFFSTHPSTGNRVKTIEEAIRAVFPGGVPEGLTP
ncbi:MAG: M48 family metalloprotease [Acidobacteria bacterium]|jgi:predicted Zn-dependent protease|nr:M48 family metalloprotease [Acidobacteriota bacterium]